VGGAGYLSLNSAHWSIYTSPSGHSLTELANLFGEMDNLTIDRQPVAPAG
jgi:hypothetical protein